MLRFGAARRIGEETFPRLVSRLTENPAFVRASYPQPADVAGATRFPTIGAFGFGSPRVMLGAHEVVDVEWRSRKAKELFFFLLANKTRPSNEELMEAMWPEASAELSGSTLKTSIYRLRQALFFDCTQGGNSGYWLNPEVPIEFDVADFRECVRLGTIPGTSDGQEEQLFKALEIYKGPFL